MAESIDDIAEARQIAIGLLRQVAPEADVEALAADQAFTDALRLDSMDFLRLIDAIFGRTGVEIPERDYPRVLTVDGLADYLLAGSRLRVLRPSS